MQFPRIVSLGCQCCVPDGLTRSNVRVEAFPFDHILSHLPEVRRLVLLTSDSDVERVDQIVGKDFYANLARSHMEAPPRLEHYHLHDSGNCLTDTNSKITFPHDAYDIARSSEKYRRRFRRLKDALTQARAGCQYRTPILFMYADSGSPNVQYSLDGEELTRSDNAFGLLCGLSDELHERDIEHRILHLTYLKPGPEPAASHPRVASSVFEPRDHWFAASDAVHYATLDIGTLVRSLWPEDTFRLPLVDQK
jgi:hypothetical protein